jgi:hypothetical protein
MDDMRVIDLQTLEVGIREVPLDCYAIDLGAGGEAEIGFRGQVGRKARRGGSIAFGTCHSLEDTSRSKSAPVH